MNVDMIANVVGFLALLGVMFFGCRFIDAVMRDYFSLDSICRRYNWQIGIDIGHSGYYVCFFSISDGDEHGVIISSTCRSKFEDSINICFDELEKQGYICRPTLKNLFKILKMKLKGRD